MAECLEVKADIRGGIACGEGLGKSHISFFIYFCNKNSETRWKKKEGKMRQRKKEIKSVGGYEGDGGMVSPHPLPGEGQQLLGLYKQ